MFIVEYETAIDPAVGVPPFEKTNGNWKEEPPAVFATESEAKEYLDALSYHWACALSMDHNAVLAYFRVVDVANARASNIHLANTQG